MKKKFQIRHKYIFLSYLRLKKVEKLYTLYSEEKHIITTTFTSMLASYFSRGYYYC